MKLTTKVLKFNLPVNTTKLETTLDEYLNNEYIYLTSIPLTSKLLIIMYKYNKPAIEYNFWSN